MSLPRYPTYKDSGVEWLGEVPGHWRVMPLGRIAPSRCDGPFGSGLKSEHYVNAGVRVIRLQNIRRGAFDGTDEAFIALDYYRRELAGHDVAAGDLLIAGLGDDNHTVGRACVAPGGIEPAMVKADCFRFRVAESQALASFVAMALCASAEADAGLLSSGSTRSRIPLSVMASRRLAVPPLPEQVHIAAFLDRETAKIDALVAEQQRLIELLKEKRQAVISHAVTKGLNPAVPMKDSGIEWLGDVPRHWEVKRLKNIAARLQGRLIVQPQLYFADEGVPIVFGYNIKEGVIDEAGLSRIDYETDRKHAHAKARAGDLFTVRLGDPGKTVVVPKSLDGCHFASIMWIHQDERFDSAWLSHSMNSAVVQGQIEAVNYGAAQTQFNIRDAVDFRLPVPPLEEQREIAAAIERQLAAIYTLTTEAQRAIDLLQERRTALISAAVTGQIDVRPGAP